VFVLDKVLNNNRDKFSVILVLTKFFLLFFLKVSALEYARDKEFYHQKIARFILLQHFDTPKSLYG